MSLLSIQFSADQDKFLREFLRLSFAEQLFADCTLYCWAEDHSGTALLSSQIKLVTNRIHFNIRNQLNSSSNLPHLQVPPTSSVGVLGVFSTLLPRFR